MLTAIVGVNWGDEGKGKMVDLLSQDYDIVVRYQGGNNAGHTVVTDAGKFVFNLLPSGILRENAVNILGTGMVIDIEHLANEIDSLRSQGVKISPDNLKVSEKATLCMPYNKAQDNFEEDRLGANAQGSTRRGIGPAYGDKYYRKALRVGDLLYPATLKSKVETVLGWKNIQYVGYGQTPITPDEILAWLNKFGEKVKPFITNCEDYLEARIESGANVVFEAQLGTLRDIDYGIYPYTTSSSALAAYAPIGAGIPGRKIERVIGIVKAYSSSVGGGPFTVEMSGKEADDLRQAGSEYGAATGRPRRVGAFDAVATRFGVRMQGATEIVLTKLDVLSYMDKIPVCVAYDINGERVTSFPNGDRLDAAKPIFEYLPGFKRDISKCRTPSELPKEALDYVKFCENAAGCRISYVAVGPHRDDYIVM